MSTAAAAAMALLLVACDDGGATARTAEAPDGAAPADFADPPSEADLGQRDAILVDATTDDAARDLGPDPDARVRSDASEGIPDADPDLDAGSATRAPGEISYRLTWDLSGVAIGEDGTWSLTTDLGFAVHLTRGWLVIYQTSLTPCAPAVEPEGLNLRRGLLWALGVGVAHAGHNDPGGDPSTWIQPTVEDLVPPTDRALGTVVVPAQTYCRAHYLVGRADEGTTGTPEAVDFGRRTFWLEGTWQRAEDVAPTPFIVRTDLANGALVGLYPPDRFGDPAAAHMLDLGARGVEVTWRRDLGHLFDGLDFAHGGEDAWARVVLTNLIDDLVGEVQ